MPTARARRAASADSELSARCRASHGGSPATRCTAVLALLACTLFPVAMAQPGLPGVRGAGGGMTTRVVSNYLDRERSLQDALEQRQRTVAVAFLAEDFTLRTSTSEDVQSGNEWLRREFSALQPEGMVRNLSVREMDDIAVVSFLLDRGTAGRRAASSTWFVVDVWRQSTQRLLSRSMTGATGVVTKPSRPSGKE